MYINADHVSSSLLEDVEEGSIVHIICDDDDSISMCPGTLSTNVHGSSVGERDIEEEARGWCHSDKGWVRRGEFVHVTAYESCER